MKHPVTLSRYSTIAMALTAVLLLGVFVFPLWVISLEAPQYPQGLGIHIWVNRIEGATPHDLQNINGLNHYIGMKAIEPAAIPELRYMQHIVIALAILAVVVALVRRRWALVTWTLLALALSGVGLYDFYRWEFDYGHNLDPSAAIKIEGMSYQPPMFGTKQLLNFRTTAWPGVGGILAMIGVGLAVAAACYEVGVRGRACRVCNAVARARTAAPATALLTLCATLAVTGCARRVQPITYGTDMCAYCEMTIIDDRYGTAFVSSTGRTHKFDSIECMLQSVMPRQKLADTEVRSWYVTDYANRGVLVDAATATYLLCVDLPSPMGAGLTAFAERASADLMRTDKGGEIMDWAHVRTHVDRWTNG